MKQQRKLKRQKVNKMSQKYPLVRDNHPGPEHNRQFVESIVQYINGKD